MVMGMATMKRMNLSRVGKIIRPRAYRNTVKRTKLSMTWNTILFPHGDFKFTSWDDWDPQNPDHDYSHEMTHHLKRLELVDHKVHKLEMQLADPSSFHTAVSRELAHAQRRRDFLQFSFLLCKVERGLAFICTVLAGIPVRFYDMLTPKNLHSRALFWMLRDFVAISAPVLLLSKYLMVYRPLPLAWDYIYHEPLAYILFQPCLTNYKAITKLVDNGLEDELKRTRRDGPFQALLRNGTLKKLHKYSQELTYGCTLVEGILCNIARHANPRLWIMASILMPIRELATKQSKLIGALGDLFTHYKCRTLQYNSIGSVKLPPKYSELRRLHRCLGAQYKQLLDDIDDLAVTTAERVSRIEPGQELDRQVCRAKELIIDFQERQAEAYRKQGVFVKKLLRWKRRKLDIDLPLPRVRLRSSSHNNEKAKITHRGWKKSKLDIDLPLPRVRLRSSSHNDEKAKITRHGRNRSKLEIDLPLPLVDLRSSNQNGEKAMMPRHGWKRNNLEIDIPLPLVDLRSSSQNGEENKITRDKAEKTGWSPPNKQVHWKRCAIHDYSPPVASCRI